MESPVNPGRFSSLAFVPETPAEKNLHRQRLRQKNYG
jgi:hypothetical protein